MPKVVYFDQEEKQEDYKDVKMMLLAGWSFKKMGDEIGKSTQYCFNLKEDLVNNGEITEKEIEDARNRARQQWESELDEIVFACLSSRKNRNYIAKNYDVQFRNINKSIDRLQDRLDEVDTRTDKEREKEEKINNIKNLILDHKSLSQIQKETEYPESTIRNYVELLINKGEIKKSDIRNETQERLEKIKKRNEVICALIEFKVPYKIIAAIFDIKQPSVASIKERYYGTKEKTHRSTKAKEIIEIREIDDTLSEQEKNILDYLNKGYSYAYMCKKENIIQKDLMGIVSSLKTRRYITQEIINQGIVNRRNYYREMIMTLYNQGISQAEIYSHLNKENVEEINHGQISKYVNILKSEGLIKMDEVQKCIDSKPNSLANFDAKILAYLKEGLSVGEIKNLDENKGITYSRIACSKERLIAAKKITKKKIAKYRQNRRKRLEEEKLIQNDKMIWYYLENYGLSNENIAYYIDYSCKYVDIRVRAIAKEKNLSIHDLRQIRQQGLINSKDKEFITYEQFPFKSAFDDVKQEFIKMYKKSIPSNEISVSYFKAFEAICKCNCTFSKEDVDILSFAVLYTDTLLNQENIYTTIMSYLSIGECNSAIKLLNSYVSLLDFNDEVTTFQNKMMRVIKNRMDNKNLKLKNFA